MPTIQEFIAKRKQRWQEGKGLEHDKKIVDVAVKTILTNAGYMKEVQENPELLIELAFYIVDKKGNTVPFFLNEVQRDFITQMKEKGTSKPYFVLKGRQQGFTSLITAYQEAKSITVKNFSGFTIADNTANAQAIFNDKARVTLDRLHPLLKPQEKFNSRNELYFDKLNSSWRVSTATNDVARGRTLQMVHYSEVAFYDCDISKLQASIGQAVAQGGLIIYESTANGYNQAKTLWDSGSCHNVFYAWYRTAEYRSNDYQYLDTHDPWLLGRIDTLYALGLDKEQVAWYCKKYAEYIDKAMIRQEYPITPEEAFVASGGSVFDIEKINEQLARLGSGQRGRKGYFEYRNIKSPIYARDDYGREYIADYEDTISDIKFVEANDGYITLYEEPKIKTNDEGYITHKQMYAIGGDTAGTGKDFFTAKVINATTRTTTAVLHKQYIDEDLYAEQMYCLGKYYNDALIGIEINYSKQPVRTLARYQYPNIYMRKVVDGLTDKQVNEYGFITSPKTRPIIIGDLVRFIRENVECEVDIATLKEMLSFVKKDNGRTEAEDGSHDDLVMATAIAHFICGEVQSGWIECKEEKENDFIKNNFKTEEAYSDGGFDDYWEDL